MPPINIDEMRTLARKRLPKTIFEFIDGGAQDEIALRANREYFERYGFRTRVLTDISQRDQSTTILGEKSASPLILAPPGLAGILHRRGELSASRAAHSAGVPYCLSTMATCSIEQIAEASIVTRWFQLYVLRDRGLTKTFIDRAEVILHGGIRRDSDVIKALCLGARACMIGRAWLYGLASGGEAGVARSLDILTKEIDLALALLGRSRLDELHPEILAARA